MYTSRKPVNGWKVIRLIQVPEEPSGKKPKAQSRLKSSGWKPIL